MSQTITITRRSPPILHSRYSTPTKAPTTTVMTTITSPRRITLRFKRKCLPSPLSITSMMVVAISIQFMTGNSTSSESSSLRSLQHPTSKPPTIRSTAANQATCIVSIALPWSQASLQSTWRLLAYIPTVQVTCTNIQTSTFRPPSTGLSQSFSMILLPQ